MMFLSLPADTNGDFLGLRSLVDRVGQESRGGQYEGEAHEGHPCHLTVRGGRSEDRGRGVICGHCGYDTPHTRGTGLNILTLDRHSVR